MKVRSIQDNLHLVHHIFEGIKDDTEAALLNLDQSKAFYSVDHRFLAAVLEITGFERFQQMDQHAVPQPAGGGAGEVKVFEGFCDRVIGSERLPLVPSSLCPSLETLLRRLRDERTRPALRAVSLTDSVRAKISAFVDDIAVFVSRPLDIVAVKMAVERYEKVAGIKVNFDKSEGLRLGA